MTFNARIHARHRLSGIRLLSLGLLIFAGSTACKKPAGSAKDSDGKASATASTTTPAASGSAAVATGPCGDLQTKFCEEAGNESTLCSSATQTLVMLSDAACKAALTDFEQTKTKIKNERKVCDDLVTFLCDGVGPNTETCKMVKEKTSQFPTDRCASMMAQSEAVLADLKRQEQANQPLSKELQELIAKSDAPALGPENAKVVIVEFSDFQCPYCSRAAEVIHKVREKYPDKVRLVFRQFPLSSHENAKPAAEASLAAHAQGKFWEYHDKLFANQRQLDSASLETYAKDTGIDVAKFKAAMENKEFSDEVQADMKMGEDVAVQGTPTMFLNGERVPNPTDFAAVSLMIDKVLGS